jgi:translation initiation factor IF-2
MANATVIEIEDMITVGALAEKLLLPVTRVIRELMKNGVMATVNERIDFDTAQIIVGELGLDVQLVRKPEAAPAFSTRTKRTTGGKGKVRPPVVAVMGHVDHGKTSLLDAIRGATVAKGEAGGITQHISAYQITHNGRAISFLDTPGHEAFAAIREHGALLTDIVIIVVAADDGVKPQTIEAIRFAKKAGVRIVVAMNKMDKEGINPDRVKQQLAEQELLVEDWGGDIVVVPVSAKTKQGISELLDMLLLVADVEELQAEVDIPGTGLIIEAHIEQGRGPVAHALVEAGTVKRGDFIVAGGTYAKIRNLESTDGTSLSRATPSTPVLITGFKTLPEFGDEFEVVANEKVARTQSATTSMVKNAGRRTEVGSSELIRMINRNNKVEEFNIIIKADVQGSLTSVIDSLKALDTEEVAVRIVGSGVGAITENDVHLAHTTGAVIYGFNVGLPAGIRQHAARDKVSTRMYKIIYELIDDVKHELSERLSPEIHETELGRLIIRAIFKTTKTDIICGGEVTKGKLTYPSLARVMRGDDEIADVEITGLKRGPADAKEIFEGEMCGLSFHTAARVDLQEGDRIELFTRESIKRSL